MSPAIASKELKRTVYARDGYLYVHNGSGFDKLSISELIALKQINSTLEERIIALETALEQVTEIFNAVIPE